MTTSAAAAQSESPRRSRGRRRRSSTAAAAPTPPPSSPAQWWERGLSPGEARQQQDDVEEEAYESSSSSHASHASSHEASQQQPSEARRALHHLNTAAAAGGVANDASPALSASPSASSSVRSPAADFLSAFASLHSVVDSPVAAAAAAGSNDVAPNTAPGGWNWRSARSLSPSAAASASSSLHLRQASYGDSAPDAASTSTVQTQALTGAALTLLDSALGKAPRLPSALASGSAARAPLAPDDEGSTLADGRYVLGRAIGFGGSSTVREAWDCAADEDATSELRRKVAVKVVRIEEDAEVEAAAGKKRNTSSSMTNGGGPAVLDDELGLWSSLPEHTHILPLLHHETVPLLRGSSLPGSNGRTAAAATASGKIIFLVMPFADVGSLLDYVRNEGAPPQHQQQQLGNVGPSLGRSSSLHAALRASPAPSTTLHHAGSLRGPRASALASSVRTGSGFLPHRNARMLSHGAPSMEPNLSSSAVLSRPYGDGSGSFSPRSSVGASLSAAGAAGLLRRGSSRLGAPTPKSRGLRMAQVREVIRQICAALQALQQHGIRHGDLKLENVLGQTASNVAAEAEELQRICWRLADFGLAARIDEDGHMELEGSSAHKKGGQGQTPRGGSLAYAPPEALRPSDAHASEAVDAASPFAADLWALGCIIYALLAGKLPFADSFEPRLQLKIAKGEWSMPARLERRKRSAARRTETASEGLRPSDSVVLLPPSGTTTDFASLSTSLSGADMSASMPVLPARASPAPLAASDTDESDSDESAADPEEHSWSGSREDRSAARELLRGLLNTDVCRRWKLQDVLHSRFLQLASLDDDEAAVTQPAVAMVPPTSSLAELPASLQEALAPPEPSEPISFVRQPSRDRSGRTGSKRDSSLSRLRPAEVRGRARGRRAASSDSRSHSGSPAPGRPAAGMGDSAFSDPPSVGDSQMSFRFEDMPWVEQEPMRGASEHDWSRGRATQRRDMSDLAEDKAWDTSYLSSTQRRAAPIDIAPRDNSGSRSRSRTRSSRPHIPRTDSYELVDPDDFRRGSPGLSSQSRPSRPGFNRSTSYETASRGRPSETAPSSGLPSQASSSSAWRGTSRSTSRPRLNYANMSGVISNDFVMPSAVGDLFSWYAAPSVARDEHAALAKPATPTATRSSTSRSRSRAPDHLKHLLNRERESNSGTSSPARREGSERASTVFAGSDDRRTATDELERAREEVEEEVQWWQRGRAREPRAANESKKSSKWPW